MTTDPYLPLVSRREMLARSAAGFGAIGLAGAMQAAGLLGGSAQAASGKAGAIPHFAPRAKRVIYLFMNGGPSHVDTFDPKPALKDHEGKLPEGDTMRKKKGGFIPSPFAFAPQGQSRSEEHTSELQSLAYLVCRLLLEKKKKINTTEYRS